VFSPKGQTGDGRLIACHGYGRSVCDVKAAHGVAAWDEAKRAPSPKSAGCAMAGEERFMGGCGEVDVQVWSLCL